MADLNSAIQLIREGRKQEAQRILEPLLEANPTNIPAWFWYVETYPNLEKRIKVLEMCLNLNQGNIQVAQALQTLRNQQRAQPVFTPPSTPSAKPDVTAARTSSSLHEEPKSSAPSSNHPYFDETPVHSSSVAAATAQPSQGQPKKAWENMDAYADTSTLSKPKVAARSYAFYEVWMTVFASFDIKIYESMLNDPEAGAGRGFEWVAYAGIISGLLAPLVLINSPEFAELQNTPEVSRLTGNMSTTALMIVMALGLAVLTPIISVISLAINGGIQNVLAVFLEAMGITAALFYALAAYLAPMTILIALLGIVPGVGQCLSSLLGFYSIVLNVRALRAAHSISTWQAIGVLFAPGIIVFILICLIPVVALPRGTG